MRQDSAGDGPETPGASAEPLTALAGDECVIKRGEIKIIRSDKSQDAWVHRWQDTNRDLKLTPKTRPPNISHDEK